MQERESNDALYAFASIPSINKEIQRMCLRGKYSTLQNIPKPKAMHDGDLCLISAVQATTNSSLLGLDIALIRAKHYVEDIKNALITQ